LNEQKRINSLDDLESIKKAYEMKKEGYRYRVLVCSGAGCISSNCHAVRGALEKALKDNGLADSVTVIETGCIGTCDLGPVMVIEPVSVKSDKGHDESSPKQPDMGSNDGTKTGSVFYTRLSPADVPAIVESHLLLGRIRMENTYADKKTGEHVPYLNDIGYFKNQVKIALRNCGSIDYSSLEEYIANDGYLALARVLEGMSQQDVIDEVKKAGLKGRGGAGFSAGVKMESGMKAPGDVKYLVCNADEGDPGAFMDRSILEGDPHSVIEGMQIEGYAIGAKKGFVYVRAEYPLAVERLGMAIDKAREAGILGRNILGSGFDFDLEIRIGAGAFECGE
jgi:(2Fe-2S) ferredoxin